MLNGTGCYGKDSVPRWCWLSRYAWESCSYLCFFAS